MERVITVAPCRRRELRGGGWRLSALALASLANLFISFNVVNIGLTLAITDGLYGDSTSADTVCSSSLILGMIFGQLLFGFCADWMGRLPALSVSLLLCAIGAFGSALLTWSSGFGSYSLALQLAMWRTILGVGAGGVYPLASTIARESASQREASHGQRGGPLGISAPEVAATASIGEEAEAAAAAGTGGGGGGGGGGLEGGNGGEGGGGEEEGAKAVAICFSFQGIGYLLVPLVYWLLLIMGVDLSLVWRLGLGLGGVGPLLLAGVAWTRRHHHHAPHPHSHHVVGGPDALQQMHAHSQQEHQRDSNDRRGPRYEEIREGEGAAREALASSSMSDSDSEQTLRTPLRHNGTLRRPNWEQDEEEEEDGKEEEDGEGEEGEEGEEEEEEEDTGHSAGQIWAALQHQELAKTLVGTAGAWFLFDITFYGNTLTQTAVLEDVFNSLDDRYRALAGVDALVALVALPGYYLAVGMMKRMGPQRMQLQGFIIIALLFALVGSCIDGLVLSANKFFIVICYCLTFLFSNFGPNSTTFIFPSLVFPEEVRGSLSGVSAAAGKLGALIGTLGFRELAASWGVAPVLLICAAVAAVGAAVTVLYVPDHHHHHQASNSATSGRGGAHRHHRLPAVSTGSVRGIEMFEEDVEGGLDVTEWTTMSNGAVKGVADTTWGGQTSAASVVEDRPRQRTLAEARTEQEQAQRDRVIL